MRILLRLLSWSSRVHIYTFSWTRLNLTGNESHQQKTQTEHTLRACAILVSENVCEIRRNDKFIFV